MLDLFVWDVASGEKIPAVVSAATEEDLTATKDWQTNWTTAFALGLPNKVALRRTEDGELLGLMSYELDEKGLAVEVIYMESARHSNANLLHAEGEHKRYYGIARLCSPMRCRYLWMRDLMASWYSKRKLVVCWTIMRVRLVHGGLRHTIRFG